MLLNWLGLELCFLLATASIPKKENLPSREKVRPAAELGRITNKYAPEDDSPSASVLGKRSHGGDDDNDDNDDSDDSDDDGRIVDSDYNEGDFGEAVQRDHGQEPEGYFGDDDQVFFLFFCPSCPSSSSSCSFSSSSLPVLPLPVLPILPVLPSLQLTA